MNTKLQSIAIKLRKTANELERKENLNNPALIDDLRAANQELIEYENLRDPSTKVKNRCTREACER
ncbi:MAG: hypothetical protein ACQERJ_01705 [Bacillota bacterium]